MHRLYGDPGLLGHRDGRVRGPRGGAVVKTAQPLQWGESPEFVTTAGNLEGRDVEARELLTLVGTDGLDGLAIMPTVLVAGALTIFVYAAGHAQIANYLLIPYVPEVGELVIFCAALVGAGLGFLWFNAYPAMVFMGDVGALALGAALGVVAVAARQELILFIMGGVFVAETISVMLQVLSFKLTGKRIFRMAPLHHHFELKGWPEPRVIVRFWILTVVLVLIGLASLKIR